MDTALHRHELPLWNPLISCGVPLAANPQFKLFYPPNLIRSAALSEVTPAQSHWSLRLYGIGHGILAGMGMFLLARRYGASPMAAILAAYALTYSAPFVFRVAWYHFIDVFAWLPLEIWILDRAIGARHGRSRAAHTILAGLIGAMAVLAGFPQMFIYCAVMIGAFVFGGALLGVSPASRDDMRLGSRLGWTLAVLVGTGIIALCASAVILLPVAELYSLSARRGSAALAAQGKTTYRSFMALAEILLLYRGHSLFVHGVGCLSGAALACAAWWHPNKRLIGLTFILIAVGLDITFGPPLPIASALNVLSPFEMPNPQRALVVAVFPVALATGFGADALAKRPAGRGGRLAAAGILVGGLLLVASAYAVDVATDSNDYFLANQEEMHFTAFLLPVLTLVTAMAAPRLGVTWSGLAFLGIIVVELSAWSTEFIHQLTERPTNMPQAIVHGAPRGISRENVRIAVDTPNANMYTLTPVIVGYEPGTTHWTMEALRPASGSDFRRELMTDALTRDNSLGNLLVKRPFWLARTWVRGALPSKSRLFPPTVVAYIDGEVPLRVPEVARRSVPDSSLFTPGARTPVTDWKRDARTGAVTGRLPEYSRHSALIVHYDAVAAGQIRPRFIEKSNKSVRYGWTRSSELSASGAAEVPLPDSIESSFTIEVEPATIRVNALEVVADRADENHLIRILNWSWSSAEVEVTNLPGPRLLVFTDSYYPGWRAYVDGKPQAVLRADNAFKAVEVPAGTHRVRFEFEPRLIYISAAISIGVWLSALTVIVVLMLGEFRQRKSVITAAAGGGSGTSSSP